MMLPLQLPLDTSTNRRVLVIDAWLGDEDDPDDFTGPAVAIQLTSEAEVQALHDWIAARARIPAAAQ